jgi:hypothetical protein
MRALIVAVPLLLSLAEVAGAQVCPPASPGASGAPWFEFQVEVPAVFIADSAKVPFPDASLNRGRGQELPPDFALVQVVVDTLGVPELTTLKMLRLPNGLTIETVAAAAATWRFRPAKASGCTVRQVVQSALRWK